MKFWVLFGGILWGLCLSAQENFLFIPNGGQWEKEVLYKTKIPGGSYFIDEKGVTYNFFDESPWMAIHNRTVKDTGDLRIKGHSIKIEFKNIQRPKKQVLNALKDGQFNYLLGNDPSKWASGLSGGKEVVLYDVYPNIDLRYYAHHDRLKYEFVVKPGGNPNAIEFTVLGADSIHQHRAGLEIFTTMGVIRDAPPLVYQGKNVIPSDFVLQDSTVRFAIGKYNLSDTLIIDPEIIFSTYSGSSALNFGYTATYDDLGFLYAGGSVFNDGYPLTAGAYDISFNSYTSYDSFIAQVGNTFRRIIYGVADMAISKYDTSGTKMIYSTYIGGRMSELPHSLVVNERGELYILGTTGSENFPVSNGAYSVQYNGGSAVYLPNGIFIYYLTGMDMVVSKLSADGGTLLASTYLGGSGNDGLNMDENLSYNYADELRGEIILSSDGSPIIASSSFSTNYPTTPDAILPNAPGNQSGVITKLNTNLSALQWSTYFGGSEADAIYSIETNLKDEILIAGGTRSTNIPLSDGVLQNTFNGGRADGMYAKLSANGDNLLFSSYFGSDTYDQIYFIREDFFGNVYVFGQSDQYGEHYIYNAAYNQPNSGQFITKFGADMQTRVWSTLFGTGNNTINISPTAFTVDLCNKVYLSGWGSNQITGGAKGVEGMEITANAFQNTTNNGDFYLMVLEDDASDLFYASYFGGPISHEHVDGGTSRFDRKGRIYQSMCAGCGFNSDLPIFPQNAHSSENRNSCNNAVLKFDFQIPAIVADFIVPEAACKDYSYSFINTSRSLNYTTYLWNFGDGNTSTDKNPSHIFPDTGSFTITLYLQDSTSCNYIDSISKSIFIRSNEITFSQLDTLCFGQEHILASNLSFSQGTTFQWSPSVGLSADTIPNPIFTVDTSRVYTLLSTYKTCVDTFIFPIYIPLGAGIKDTLFGCEGDTQAYLPSLAQLFSPLQVSAHPSFQELLNPYPNSDIAQIIFKDTSWIYLNYTKEFCPFTDSSLIHTRKLNYQIEPDSIVCGDDAVSRNILYPPEHELSKSTWLPTQYVQNANLTSAQLLPYDFISDFTVAITDIYGCYFESEISLLNLGFEVSLPDTTICLGDTLVIGFDIADNAQYSFSWSPDSIVENPSAIFTHAWPKNNGALRLFIDNSFCADTLVLNLEVIQHQSTFLPSDTLFCNITEKDFPLNQQVPGAYQWYRNNQLIHSGSNLFNPSIPFEAGNNTIVVQGYDQFNCPFGDTTQVFYSFIEVSLPTDSFICSVDTISLVPNINSFSTPKYYWEPFLIFINDTTDAFAEIYFTQGNYTVNLWVSNQENCTDSAQINLIKPELVEENIQLSIQPDKIALGEQTFVSYYPTRFDLQWNGGNPISSNNGVATFEPQQSTYLTAILSDEVNGVCYKSDSVFVEVVEVLCGPPYVFVPNAFSPNKDGMNDILYVRGREITAMYFAIFDRWGEKVFESTNKNNGWDGTYKGNNAAPKVYDYYLEYECAGTARKFLKGNITLIR